LTQEQIAQFQQEQQQRMGQQDVQQQLPRQDTILAQQAMAQAPISSGRPLATSPLVNGAMALPSLGALAGAIPATIGATGIGGLTTFPTLAFGARWVDLYTPLFATSARVAAIAGLPLGMGISTFARLHFFGINTHFGLYAPYLLWNGSYRPFFINNPINGLNYYPFLAATGGVLSPFTYTSPLLPGAYGAVGLGGACGAGIALAASGCPAL
jgi:hypothetical protein